ncbi:hypothetical protein [Rhodoferax fermentans]|uniref:Uncharacterized protein n=1 Tax=Rhodoferax fermentans TaxID=28066 RepID=A0A1T1AVJ8_RHOFE|nr:hypothetical protein [Rhodoferax fermentans]MBK1682100.1 hypothetical protein [Rhodoferax fermentans]OOV08077.1 hypothetical protein RF819_16335 [Rhodoferax fermentans]
MPNTQPPANIDLLTAVLAKTALGQHEVATRTIGLPPLTRRLLILVDGKRSGQELAMFVAGHPVAELLGDLLQRQCIEVVGSLTAPPAARSGTLQAATTPTGAQADLATLPPPEKRSALELTMARNFMINTVNMEFGQHMRMSLVKAVGESSTAAELRQVYPLWLSTMAAAKDLPTLKDKLFRVL